MFEKLQFRVSPERHQTVENDIRIGSEPGFRFYLMVAASTMIASFGLITNSTAVIIGAMLVAPLMTPIFGMALALIRGDAPLLGKSIRAEIAGVVAAVAMGFVLGSLTPALEPTPEMLARTHPNLFDLMVAVFAGFAGSYALVDEHLSPALPGVAIATAIVPPLANTGLCFSVGAFAGATGSFLLFFANFLSILLVASATFWFSGMVREAGTLTRRNIFRRFGLPTIGFVLVGGFLSYTLFETAQKRLLENSIRSCLTAELASLPATGMDRMIFEFHEGNLYVLAEVHSPNIFSPRQVKRIQDRLSEQLGETTELIVRSKMANDVSAFGSTNQGIVPTLDGFFISPKIHPSVQKTKSAEKIIRDYLSSQLGLNLYEVDLLQLEDRQILLASIHGIRALSAEEIRQLEQTIQESLKDENMRLLVRFVGYELQNRNGIIRYEWATLSAVTPEQWSDFDRTRAILNDEFSRNGTLFLTNANAAIVDGNYHFLLEVVGTGGYSSENVKKLERRISKEIGKLVNIHVWYRPEYVVSGEGYASYQEATRRFFKKQERTFTREIDGILDAMR